MMGECGDVGELWGPNRQSVVSALHTSPSMLSEQSSSMLEPNTPWHLPSFDFTPLPLPSRFLLQ
jgi:hypothetical protein